FFHRPARWHPPSLCLLTPRHTVPPAQGTQCFLPGSLATSEGTTAMRLDGKQAFLAIMPKVLAHARFAFRFVRCEHTREDKIAESIALVFKWTLSLAERGKDVRDFPSAIASYATRAVKSGRKLCSARRSKDPLS